MTDEGRAKLIRAMVMVVFLGGAVVAGLLLKLPGLPSEKAEVSEALTLKMTRENYTEFISQEKRLAVVNMKVDGSPESQKLEEVLRQLEQRKKFGERVAYAEVDVAKEPELAKHEGVNPENFSGQLNFFAEGKRLGVLRGETDPVVIEETIQRYLDGLVKRYGPGWLPEVEGMERAKGDETILKVEPADPVKP